LDTTHSGVSINEDMILLFSSRHPLLLVLGLVLPSKPGRKRIADQLCLQ
jgi:hypothetical protein